MKKLIRRAAVVGVMATIPVAVAAPAWAQPGTDFTCAPCVAPVWEEATASLPWEKVWPGRGGAGPWENAFGGSDGKGAWEKATENGRWEKAFPAE